MTIGESIPMLDSVERVTGKTEYLVNLSVPNMLVGKIVRSTVPHANLTNVDVSKAEQVPGVVAILTGADLGPDERWGPQVQDQDIVATGRVRFVGEPVVAIAAESIEAAEEAAALVEIEYEELPVVYDALEAIKPGAPVLHEEYPDNILIHAKLRHGDLEAGFTQADHVFEHTFTSPAAQPASLEPHGTIAQWDGDQLTVWSGTQAPYAVKQTLSGIFGLPPEAVRVIVPPLGGGYGGKAHIRIQPLVVALARKTNGRPVKIVLSRAEEFVLVTKHAAVLTYKTGVRDDGTLTARQVTSYWNGGAYADATPQLVGSVPVRSVGPYRIPAVHVDAYGVYTNLPKAAAFRGAMSSQATWAYESHMDMIAREMDWDPLEFRLKNVLRDGDLYATGEPMHDVHWAECLQASVDGLTELQKKSTLEPPDPSGSLRHGTGMAAMLKSTISTSKSEARLSYSDQGVLTVYTSTVEMGQGTHTGLSQIAAESMDVAHDMVHVVGPDTAKTPFDATTAAARSTTMMGNAVIAAAENLKEELKKLAEPIFETAAEELQAEGGHIRSVSGESMSYQEVLQRNNLEVVDATGEFATKFDMDPETGQGISGLHMHQGAGACEVEVDVETGRITVLCYYGTSFAGRIINPLLAQLQNDGNIIYGLGPTLLEEMIFDGGQVTNPNFSDYMLPSFLDIPVELDSHSLESESGEIHGIGEMTLPSVSPAVASAIEDAVGVRITDLPITAERVLRALKEKNDR